MRIPLSAETGGVWGPRLGGVGRAVALAALGWMGLACTGEIDGAESALTADAGRARDAAAAGAVDAPAVAAADAAVVGPDASKGSPCSTVAHIGDSLSAYTVEPLKTAYAAVGATAQVDAYGGRAILQKLPADPKTGKQAALDFRAAGFTGCWVVALGTNDTANVAAGNNYTRAKAIDEMMKAIDPGAAARVLWVNTYTLRTDGYYDNDNMVLWNQALLDARARWANLVIYDWAAVAATGVAPYVDGIHHTAAGFAVRNEAIAKALALLSPP